MAFLQAFGAYVPERVVTSEEAASWVGATAAWVNQVSGIEERRFAAEDQSVAHLAALAGRDCLARAGMAATDLALILVASGSAEQQFPGPAAATAHLLGLAGIPAIDLPLASAGSLFGLTLAARLAPTMGPVLVIGTEKMSRLVGYEPRERGVAILFGDGAGAALVHPEAGFLELGPSSLGSDGAFSDDLCAPHLSPIRMNGRQVILQASRKIPQSIRTVLAAANVNAGDVEVFLMHQANQNLIDKVAESLGVPSPRFYSNIRRYGNTSSASMLIAASEWRAGTPALRPGAPVVFSAFGAGFHYGALLGVATAL